MFCVIPLLRYETSLIFNVWHERVTNSYALSIVLVSCNYHCIHKFHVHFATLKQHFNLVNHGHAVIKIFKTKNVSVLIKHKMNE